MGRGSATMTTAAATTQPIGAPADKGLRGSAIGLLSSVVIGLAATAPAYSITATLGFIVLAIGFHAPAMMVLAFLPMMAIAVAFAQLNRADPDCGTTFTWTTRAFAPTPAGPGAWGRTFAPGVFRPYAGWLGGWGMTFAAVIAMAYLAGIAASYFFLLFGADGLATQRGWLAIVGTLIVALMTYVCYRGIRLSARLQYLLFGIEAIMLLVFSFVAIGKTATGHAPPGHVSPSWSCLSPFDVGGFQAFTAGLLLALFIYWGWDSALSINEETSNRRVNPGRAAITATLVLLALYLLVTFAAQSYAGVGDTALGLGNPDRGVDA